MFNPPSTKIARWRWHGRWRRRAWRQTLGGAVCVFCALIIYLTYFWTERIGIDALRQSGAQRLDVYAASLENLLDKYDFLPKTLELNKDVIGLLNHPGDKTLRTAVNVYLETVNQQAKSNTIYIVNLQGLTQAASNWREQGSFIGDDVSFRPYVQDAMRGASGGFYGVGTTKLEPGYFFAHGIYHDGKMVGVASVKVNIEQLEKTWAAGADKVILADEHGVIFLSSVAAWKYKTLAPLASAVRQRLSVTRQYYSHPLPPLALADERTVGEGARIVTVRTPAATAGKFDQSAKLLLQSRSMPSRNWQFSYLSDLTQVRQNARAAAGFSGLLLGFFILLSLYMRQRQRAAAQSLKGKKDLQHAYDHLETMVAERTFSLNQMTQSLTEEIVIRRQAESELHMTQNALFQAGKMALLGQMSAGITHELNQPLTALRTMSDNAVVLLERGRLDQVKSNLGMIAQIVGRMGSITGKLKVFARKSTTRLTSVSIRAAINDALFLVERRLELEGVSFQLTMDDGEVHALCESNRLEQVLVNLFANALDAMTGCGAPRRLMVAVLGEQERVLIRVADSGCGLSEEARQHLFEPFFTTKPQGLGLGLGLTISEQIVHGFGGILRAETGPGEGACFVIELRMTRQEEEEHV